MRAHSRGASYPLFHVDAKSHPQFFPDGLCFQHHGFCHGACARFCCNHVQGGVCQHTDRVETEVAPQLHPDFIAYFRSHGRLETGADQRFAQLHAAFRFLTTGFAQGKPVPLYMLNHARFADLAGRISNTTDDALRANLVPLTVVRINTFQLMIFPRSLESVKIPPGNAVGRGHHTGFPPQQRLHGTQDTRHRRGFQGNNHIVLATRFNRIVRTFRICCFRSSIGNDF